MCIRDSSQPDNVQVTEHNEFMDAQGFEGDIVPASAWMNWNIYQPARYYLIDFADNNGHQDLESGENGAYGIENYSADEEVWASGTFTITDQYWPDDVDFATVPVDAICTTRASEVVIDGGDSTSNMIDSSLVITKHGTCLLYTSPSPRDATLSRMPSSA